VAVRIRLKKMGRKNRPFYRIVAADARAKRDGKELENLGYYDPLNPSPDKQVAINRDRVRHWLEVGAQPTKTAASILRRLQAI